MVQCVWAMLMHLTAVHQYSAQVCANVQARTWAAMKDWAAMEGLLKDKKPPITPEAVINLAKQAAAPPEAIAR